MLRPPVPAAPDHPYLGPVLLQQNLFPQALQTEVGSALLPFVGTSSVG
jgi:hypothetical protein